MPILQPIRQITNTYCSNQWVCGEPISAFRLNEMLLNSKAAFRNGQSVLSLSSSFIGNSIEVPIVGHCHNVIQGFSNNNDTEIQWKGGSDIRFQPASPYYHDYISLVNGLDQSHGFGVAVPNPMHTLPIIGSQGQEGMGHLLGTVENTEANRLLLQCEVRRAKKYLVPYNSNQFTGNSSRTHIFELDENINNNLFYTQHLQIWLEHIDISGATVWTKLADDNDFSAVNQRVGISKVMPIAPPQPSQSVSCNVWCFQWFEMPLYLDSGSYYPRDMHIDYLTSGNRYHFVMGTSLYETTQNGKITAKPRFTEGLLNINVKLFKEC